MRMWTLLYVRGGQANVDGASGIHQCDVSLGRGRDVADSVSGDLLLKGHDVFRLLECIGPAGPEISGCSVYAQRVNGPPLRRNGEEAASLDITVRDEYVAPRRHAPQPLPSRAQRQLWCGQSLGRGGVNPLRQLNESAVYPCFQALYSQLDDAQPWIFCGLHENDD